MRPKVHQGQSCNDSSMSCGLLSINSHEDYFGHAKNRRASPVSALPGCYYHPRTSSIIADRKLVDSGAVSGLMRLLPEDERYGLKYVTICLKDGIAGEVDRE